MDAAVIRFTTVGGHYMLAGGRTADWLPSGAGVTTERFEAIWDAVAAAIAASTAVPRRPAKR
jgi:hypothetical protein